MKTVKWLNLAAFIAMIFVNIFANIFSIGGNTTGHVSENYANLFTPAPVTFAIWGVIYLFMAAYVVYQLGFFDKGNHSSQLNEIIGGWFLLSCLCNIAWILAWHNDFIGLSMFCMAGLLFSLIRIVRGISEYNGNMLGKFMVNTGFEIYLGWIVAATVANAVVLFTKTGWNSMEGLGFIWISIVLLAVGGIGSGIVWLGHKYFAGLSIIWAYTGILIRHFSYFGFNAKYPVVIAASFIGIAMILSSIIIDLFSNGNRIGITKAA